jgi:DNA-binding transcriptional ArsR family regulator
MRRHAFGDGNAGSTLSHHLDKLKNENLVKVRREGTFLRYTANADSLQGSADIPLRGMLHAQPGLRR